MTVIPADGGQQDGGWWMGVDAVTATADNVVAFRQTKKEIMTLAPWP